MTARRRHRIKPRKLPADLLQDRVVMVTGASSGIGRALALDCAARGARVILHGRRVAALEALYDRILADGGARPAILPLDFVRADESAYADAAEKIHEAFGRLDGLVHCAGLLGTLTPLGQQGFEEWHRVMQVNLNAPFALTRACMPLLRAAEDASVVFVSSGVAPRPRAYWGAYAVSKAGVEALSTVLADEVDNIPGLRVNCINPGPVRTGMRAAAFPAEDPATLDPPEAVTWAFLQLLGPGGAKAMNGALYDLA